MPSTLRRLVALALVVELLLLLRAAAHADPTRAVVFVAPSAFELDGALRDALSAQLSGADTQLTFEHFSADATTLRRQVTEARALAASHHALGVFWLDAPIDKDWLLYLAEAGGDRVLVRRITFESGGGAAATEAVSVITSESSVALASGQTIGMQPVVLPPEPEPAPATSASAAPAAVVAPPPAASTPPRPTRNAPPSPQFFAGLGYYGDGLAQEIRWQSGARLSLGVLFSNRLYLNAGYVFFKEATVRGSQLTFQVTRTPLDLGGGVVLARGRWAPALEVRAQADVLSRQSIATGTELDATPSATRVMISVSPRARLDFAVSRSLGVYAAGGIDAVTNPFSYVSRVDGRDSPLLRPAVVRPAFELGASFEL